MLSPSPSPERPWATDSVNELRAQGLSSRASCSWRRSPLPSTIQQSRWSPQVSAGGHRQGLVPPRDAAGAAPGQRPRQALCAPSSLSVLRGEGGISGCGTRGQTRAQEPPRLTFGPHGLQGHVQGDPQEAHCEATPVQEAEAVPQELSSQQQSTDLLGTRRQGTPSVPTSVPFTRLTHSHPHCPPLVPPPPPQTLPPSAGGTAAGWGVGGGRRSPPQPQPPPVLLRTEAFVSGVPSVKTCSDSTAQTPNRQELPALPPTSDRQNRLPGKGTLLHKTEQKGSHRGAKELPPPTASLPPPPPHRPILLWGGKPREQGWLNTLKIPEMDSARLDVLDTRRNSEKPSPNASTPPRASFPRRPSSLPASWKQNSCSDVDKDRPAEGQNQTREEHACAHPCPARPTTFPDANLLSPGGNPQPHCPPGKRLFPRTQAEGEGLWDTPPTLA